MKDAFFVFLPAPYPRIVGYEVDPLLNKKGGVLIENEPEKKAAHRQKKEKGSFEGSRPFLPLKPFINPYLNLIWAPPPAPSPQGHIHCARFEARAALLAERQQGQERVDSFG